MSMYHEAQDASQAPSVEGRGDGAKRGLAPANTPISTILLYFSYLLINTVS